MIKVTYIGHSSFLVEWPIIITKGVCQVKCVSFFDFIWRSVFDRHIYTINLIKW